MISICIFTNLHMKFLAVAKTTVNVPLPMYPHLFCDVQNTIYFTDNFAISRRKRPNSTLNKKKEKNLSRINCLFTFTFISYSKSRMRNLLELPHTRIDSNNSYNFEQLDVKWRITVRI